MSKFIAPSPILDGREEQRLISLTADYQKFIAPGRISKAIGRARDAIVQITPEKFKKLSGDAFNAASEHAVIQKAMAVAGKGLGVLGNQSAQRLVVSAEGVVQTLSRPEHPLTSYRHICGLRSYTVEEIVKSKGFQHRALAFLEGGITGAPGLVGIPFNIALSFLLFFRATQSIAMYYGYDVKREPSELEAAAQITLECLAPGTAAGEESFSGLIAKMMAVGELSALNASLSKTYAQMIGKKGFSLFYVQFRALANKAAEKALKKAGEKGIEAGIYKNLLEQVAKQVPKATAQRAIPLISGFIGAGVDSYVMHRILIGANLVYHKRFIVEKADRIKTVLKDG
jgi:hypothetical protein